MSKVFMYFDLSIHIKLFESFPETAGEPSIQLKGFTKVFLEINQQATVQFALTARELSIWDVVSHSWQVYISSATVA